MFFEHFEMHDFRSHVETKLDLARLNIIRGSNAAGKSSLAQAFGYLLAARSADTGENGQGGELLIREGAKKAMLMALLSTGTKARVTITPKSGRDFQHKDGDWPRYSRDVLSCLCSTRYFLNLPTKRQQEVLGAMVIPPDAPIDPRVLTLAKTLGLTGDAPDAYTWLANLYDAAFGARRDAKRDLKALAPVETPDPDAFPLEEVRTRLYQRRKERDTKRDERAALLQSTQNYDRQHTELQKRLTTLEGREIDEERRIQTLTAKLLSDDLVTKHKKAIENEPQTAKMAEQFTKIDNDLKLAEREAAALRAIASEPTCPTCRQAITEEHLQSLVAPLGVKQGHLLSQRSDLGKQLGAQPSAAEARQKLAQHESAKEELEVTQQRLAQIQADLKAIREEIHGMVAPSAVNTDTLNTEIAQLDENIAAGERAERAALRAEHLATAHTAYKLREAELGAAVADLESLVALTAPDGVRAAMATRYMDEFFGILSTVLSNFGYEVSQGDTWALNAIDLARLSESEKLRFGVALQMALAISSGAGFLIIDEFELLDAASRGALMDMLQSETRIEQAIVIGTNDSLDVPTVDGVAFFRFSRQEDGTSAVFQLGEEVAA